MSETLDVGRAGGLAASTSACRRRRPSRSGRPWRRPSTIAVWPSAEIESPARGGTTERDVGVRAQDALDARDRLRGSRASLVVSSCEWTTTISAELERPAKFRWISVRAWTDSEPFACQPAPESAVSTFGAKTPSATATTAQAIATARTWSAVQRPSLPIGPTASAVLGRGAEARRCVGDASPARTADELVQAAQLLLDGAADLLAEREDALVDDPVVDVVALLAAAEDAGVGEHGQVLGDVLLRGAESPRTARRRSPRRRGAGRAA